MAMTEAQKPHHEGGRRGLVQSTLFLAFLLQKKSQKNIYIAIDKMRR